MRTQSEFSVDILTHPVELREARLLHGERYLKAGYVDHLSPDGTIDDEWVSSSTYFGARDCSGAIVGVCRLIPNSDDRLLPVAQEFELDPTWVRWLHKFPPNAVAEVSALAVSETCGFSGGVRVIDALFGAMTCHSVDSGSPFWVAAVDKRVYRHLTRLHGFRFERLGPAKHYLGSMTVPVRLDLFAQLREYDALMPKKLDDFMIDLTGDEVRLQHDAFRTHETDREPAIV